MICLSPRPLTSSARSTQFSRPVSLLDNVTSAPWINTGRSWSRSGRKPQSEDLTYAIYSFFLFLPSKRPFYLLMPLLDQQNRVIIFFLNLLIRKAWLKLTADQLMRSESDQERFEFLPQPSYLRIL
jgi:hypothetical protein